MKQLLLTCNRQLSLCKYITPLVCDSQHDPLCCKHSSRCWLLQQLTATPIQHIDIMFKNQVATQDISYIKSTQSNANSTCSIKRHKTVCQCTVLMHTLCLCNTLWSTTCQRVHELESRLLLVTSSQQQSLQQSFAARCVRVLTCLTNSNTSIGSLCSSVPTDPLGLVRMRQVDAHNITLLQELIQILD